jgi:hypothetical protein
MYENEFSINVIFMLMGPHIVTVKFCSSLKSTEIRSIGGNVYEIFIWRKIIEAQKSYTVGHTHTHTHTHSCMYLHIVIYTHT